MSRKLSIGILGGAGLIAQCYVFLLRNHPLFQIEWIATTRAQKKDYLSLTKEDWIFEEPPPSIPLVDYDNLPPTSLIFSALPNEPAAKIDRECAKNAYVISHASIHRSHPLIPLIIPEINPHHLALLEKQKDQWKIRGGLIAKPNCTLHSFLPPLAPLHKMWGLKTLHLTLLQARSGQGLNALKNMYPYESLLSCLPQEEQKVQIEPLKILGSLSEETISPLKLSIRVNCLRVSVPHGHLATVNATFITPPRLLEIETLLKLDPLFQVHKTLEIQKHLTSHHISIGDLRLSEMGELCFSALSHNLFRGGAGGGLLIAELLHQKGYFNETQSSFSTTATPLPLSTYSKTNTRV